MIIEHRQCRLWRGPDECCPFFRAVMIGFVVPATELYPREQHPAPSPPRQTPVTGLSFQPATSDFRTPQILIALPYVHSLSTRNLYPVANQRRLRVHLAKPLKVIILGYRMPDNRSCWASILLAFEFLDRRLCAVEGRLVVV